MIKKGYEVEFVTLFYVIEASTSAHLIYNLSRTQVCTTSKISNKKYDQ